ncbi:hypothetical protein BJX62DRAFT_238526 [Aspergillus germanicus]
MRCQIPDKMCSICQTKYTSLSITLFAHKRSAGENIYQVIFTRYLYSIHTFAHLEIMATNFARNIKSLSDIAVDPIISALKYGPKGGPNGASMYISMLVGFPRPLLFPDDNQSERHASEMLDELVGIGIGIEGLPAQPVGTLWIVSPIDEKDGHHSLVRLGWLQEAVDLARGVPAHVARKKLYGTVTVALADCFVNDNKGEIFGPFELPA